MALPVHELLANARHEVKRQLLWLLGLLPLAVLLGLLAGRRLVAPLRTLAAQVRHLANFNFSFSQPVSVASRVREIRELTEVIDRMTHTIRNLQWITHTRLPDGQSHQTGNGL